VTRFVDVIRRVIQNTDRTTHLLDALAQGVANHSNLFNEKATEIIEGMRDQSGVTNQRLLEIVAGLKNQSRILNDKLDRLIEIQSTQVELQRTQTEMLERLSTAITNRGR